MSGSLDTSADTDTAVYTHGWDTVYVLPATAVNAAIVAAKSTPPTFDYKDATDAFELSGSFGDWQLETGGSGKEIRMLMPLETLAITYDSTGDSDSYNGSAVFGIELAYIPHTDNGAATSTVNLMVNTTQTDPNTPIAFLVTLQLLPKPDLVTQACIQTGLTEWVIANLGLFQHVFAAVDLNQQADKGNFAFVAPNCTSYAYLTDHDNAANDLFGVLTMTGTRTGDGLTPQVPQNAIPASAECGFLISQTLALTELFQPAIILAYPGLTPNDFILGDNGNTLSLASGTSVKITTPEVDDQGYATTLTALQLTSVGQIITLTSHTSTEVAPGITAECQAQHWYTVTLGTSSNGQTLVFTQAQDPVIQHTITASPGVGITQAIIGLVGSLALVVLTILTDGAALIVGGLVIGLLLGADAILPSLIETLNTSDAPPIDLLQVNAVDPITWADSKGFTLTLGGMNNALQLGGTQTSTTGSQLTS